MTVRCNNYVDLAGVNRLQPLRLGPYPVGSGTEVLIPGIPAWAKRAIVGLYNISLTTSHNIEVRLGTSAGIEATGYNSTSARVATGNQASNTSTTGFVATPYGEGSDSDFVFTIFNMTGNIWMCGITGGDHGHSYGCSGGGRKTLGGVLTQMAVVAMGGNFDAGQVVVLVD